MLRKLFLLLGLAAAALAAGCNSPVAQEQIQVANVDPLEQPRAVLTRYAQGQPLGSEVTSFPYMVEQVRKVDPQKADLLDKGLQDLQQAAPAARAAKAKDLLNKLQSSTT